MYYIGEFCFSSMGKKVADPIRAVSGVKPSTAYMISFCINFRL